MNNPCLFKYIAVLFALHIFVLFFVVNKTLNVNVVVVNTHPGQDLGLMSTASDRPLFYGKKNEIDDHDVGKGNKNGKVKSRRAILDVQVKCPTNISIDNGYVSFNENETLATYRCAYGFRLVGSALVTCKEDRTWSLPPPKCAVQCHTDLAIRNGIVKFSKDHNSVAYWCVTGFNRVGSSSATCKEDGTWSSPPPKCTTVQCSTHIQFYNGIATFNEDKNFVTFKCINELRLVGSSSATCREDGTWSSPPPICRMWAACRWSKNSRESTMIAERIAANPSELRSAAIHCVGIFRRNLHRMSKSTVTRLCDSFRVSNLTSPVLQFEFMYCTGLYFYRYFSDEEGNVQVPSQFHNCKKMSFRNSGISALLVSWPGSGNSWVRQLLESTTGIYTGSNDDCDLSYIKAGMFGEGINSEHVIAVKFHMGPLPKINFKKVIYIIRNPYNAIVADYQRHRASQDPELSQNSHTHELNMDEFDHYREWSSYVTKSAVGWRSHVRRWLDSQLPHRATLLVVKFENLLTNLRTELIRIMKYLEYPYTEEDIECTIRQSNVNVFHRNHTKHFEHYTQMEVDIIYEQIKMAERIFRKHNISIYDKHVLQI